MATLADWLNAMTALPAAVEQRWTKAPKISEKLREFDSKLPVGPTTLPTPPTFPAPDFSKFPVIFGLDRKYYRQVSSAEPMGPPGPPYDTRPRYRTPPVVIQTPPYRSPAMFATTSPVVQTTGLKYPVVETPVVYSQSNGGSFMPAIAPPIGTETPGAVAAKLRNDEIPFSTGKTVPDVYTGVGY